MGLIGEVGIAQINKNGEELCGDVVDIIRSSDDTVVVLSDGLGSGVKANILANLTAKIASQMISQDIPVEDVVNTLVATLPTCKTRGIAYSTFSILRLYTNGIVYLVDFDGCPMVRINDDGLELVATSPTDMGGRTINEASFRMNAGETLIIVSDGVTQAGLGDLFPLGLGAEGLIDTLERYVDLEDSVQTIANRVVNICKSYYQGEPGDDTTCVVMRLKEESRAVLMTGPPASPSDDARMVRRFLSADGIHIIAGGTTAQIFCREAGRDMHSDFTYVSDTIPPISRIAGVDLTTEGVITLSEVRRLLETHELPAAEDGASLMLQYLLDADRITVLQGCAENPAMKEGQVVSLDLRDVVVEKLVKALRGMGKIVEVEQF